jgi:hypothetical protein
MRPEIPFFVLNLFWVSHQCIIKVNCPGFGSVNITVDDLHVVDEIVFEVFGLEEVGEEIVDDGGGFVVFDDVEPH